MASQSDKHAAATIERFIDRWSGVTGTEQSNAQMFLYELCQALDLPIPDAEGDEDADNPYVFERTIIRHDPDGTAHTNRADLYRRGCFILEAKKLKAGESTAVWDKAMQRAFHQAERYARALPIEEGRPPLIITVDVGVAYEFSHH